MLLYVVGGGMYRFAAVEGYCDEGDFDGGAEAGRWPYFNFAFYPRLQTQMLVLVMISIARPGLTYQSSRNARVPNQKVAIWRPTYPHEGSYVRPIRRCHNVLRREDYRARPLSSRMACMEVFVAMRRPCVCLKGLVFSYDRLM